MDLSNCKYSKSHEWVCVEDDKAYVGISDHAQGLLGDIVYVDLPKIGAEIIAGNELGTVESVKAVSEFYSPISGTIIEINEDLNSSPELLNENAAENWITAIKPLDLSELDGLMTAEQYEEFCEQEG